MALVGDFGEDNREEPYSEDVANSLRLLGQSVAIIVDTAQAQVTNSSITLKTEYLEDYVKRTEQAPLCEGERFGRQPIVAPISGRVAPCTGFLINDTTLLTAKHCVANIADCSRTLVVFGYQMESEDVESHLNTADVFRCSRVEPDGSYDFSLLYLDRSTGRSGLSLSSQPPETDLPVVLVGHPVGLPQKITIHGNVQAVDSTTLETNLDAFAGNSGSPVVNREDRSVVGLQVRGALDGDWETIEIDGTNCTRALRCKATPGPWGPCLAGEAIRADVIVDRTGGL